MNRIKSGSDCSRLQDGQVKDESDIGKGSPIRKLKGIVVGGIAAAAFLVLAPQSSAVTIGHSLSNAPNTADGCEILVLPPLRQTVPLPPNCTFFSAEAQTPPGSYVVTTGRLRTGPRTGPMMFTAVRAMRSKASVDGMPAGVICCTSEAESQVFTPPPNSTVDVPIRLPMRNTTTVIDGEQVELIDYLGITLLNQQASAPVFVNAPALSSAFAPALRAGEQQLMGSFPGAILINGEFTPCGAGSSASASAVAGCPGGGGGGNSGGGGGDTGGGNSGGNANRPNFRVAKRTPLAARGTAARVIVRTPRGGAIRVQPVRKFSRFAGRSVTRAKRGVNRVTVRLTRPGRRVLARRGKLRVPVKVTFRARGGAAAGKRAVILFRR